MIVGASAVVAFPATGPGAPARAARRQFGQGPRPARPTLGRGVGDALAKVSGAPLLVEGSDFARTDARAAP